MASGSGGGILPGGYPRSDDRLGSVQAEVDQVSGIMKQNVEVLVSQGEALHDLTSKTDDLLSEARTFKKSSTDMKNALWWKDMQTKLIVGGVAFIVLLIIFFNVKNAFKGDDY